MSLMISCTAKLNNQGYSFMLPRAIEHNYQEFLDVVSTTTSCNDFTLYYMDDEGDRISLSSAVELSEALNLAFDSARQLELIVVPQVSVETKKFLSAPWSPLMELRCTPIFEFQGQRKALPVSQTTRFVDLKRMVESLFHCTDAILSYYDEENDCVRIGSDLELEELFHLPGEKLVKVEGLPVIVEPQYVSSSSSSAQAFVNAYREFKRDKESEKQSEKTKSIDEDEKMNVFKCHNCSQLIVGGIMYKCSICQDYKLCEACEGNLHVEHVFYKIRGPSQMLPGAQESECSFATAQKKVAELATLLAQLQMSQGAGEDLPVAPGDEKAARSLLKKKLIALKAQQEKRKKAEREEKQRRDAIRKEQEKAAKAKKKEAERVALLRAEEERKRQEDLRVAEEQKKRAEEAARLLIQERKRRALEEIQRAEEAARLVVEQKKKAAEEAQRAEEAARLLDEQKKKAAEEAQRAEEAARLLDEQRKRAEEARLAEEEYRRKQQQEAEWQRHAAEALQRIQEEQKKKEEAELARKRELVNYPYASQLQMLVEMGFPRDKSMLFLTQNNGNIDETLYSLL